MARRACFFACPSDFGDPVSAKVPDLRSEGLEEEEEEVEKSKKRKKKGKKLDCYWVGSLDFNFLLGKKVVFF